MQCVQTSPVCLPCKASDVCVALIMCAAWGMDVFRRTSLMVSLPLAQGVSAVRLCGSTTLAAMYKVCTIGIESWKYAAADRNNLRCVDCAQWFREDRRGERQIVDAVSNLGLLARGSQSAVVICRSIYELGGGDGTTRVVLFLLPLAPLRGGVQVTW